MNTTKEFNEIYAKHYNSILRNLLCKGANYYDAEEIANDTFLKAQKNWNKFDANIASVKTWLNEISYNLFIDKGRSLKAKNTAEISMDAFIDVEGHESMSNVIDFKSQKSYITTDYKIENQQFMNRVKEVMSKMNGTQRQIAELLLINDVSQVEIAKILNMPINSVKGNLTRIREIMSNHFQAEKLEYGFTGSYVPTRYKV